MRTLAGVGLSFFVVGVAAIAFMTFQAFNPVFWGVEIGLGAGAYYCFK